MLRCCRGRILVTTLMTAAAHTAELPIGRIRETLLSTISRPAPAAAGADLVSREIYDGYGE